MVWSPRTKNRIKNSPRMTLSTVNFAAATLSKPNTRTVLTYWEVDWPQNKSLSNWNCQSHPLLELKNINTCNRYESKNRWAYSRTSCGSRTIKTLCQLWRQCKNDCFLPRQKHRYVEAWLYITKPRQNFLTQIYWCKILPIHGRR